jgi:hypothetical protein
MRTFRRNPTAEIPWVQVTCGEDFPLEVDSAALQYVH